jgi:hypothetical protein
MLSGSLSISGQGCGKSSGPGGMGSVNLNKLPLLLQSGTMLTPIYQRASDLRASRITLCTSFIWSQRNLRPREVRGLVQGHTAREGSLEFGFPIS